MPLNCKKYNSFDSYYLKSTESHGIIQINKQLNILKNKYAKSEYYRGINKNKIDYEIEYLSYLKFWHEVTIKN